MAIEILDKGFCKAAGNILTAVSALDARVSMKGIEAALIESTSSILLTLEDPIAASELFVLTQRLDSSGVQKVTRVSDTQIRIETLTDAGAAAQGLAWVLIGRLPRAAQNGNVTIAP